MRCSLHALGPALLHLHLHLLLLHLLLVLYLIHLGLILLHHHLLLLLLGGPPRLLHRLALLEADVEIAAPDQQVVQRGHSAAGTLDVGKVHKTHTAAVAIAIQQDLQHETMVMRALAFAGVREGGARRWT